MTRERVIVTGFGRCGSTMLMRMLAAGGLRVIGSRTSFETRDVETPEGWRRLLERDAHAQPAAAVKALHPFLPPPGPAFAFLWLDRDPHEQARSHVKFLAATTGMQLSGRDRRAYRAGLRRGRLPALRELRGYPHSRLMVLSFEGVLARPLDAAARIADWFPTLELDVRAMAETVIARGPKCLPGLLELDMMAAGAGR